MTTLGNRPAAILESTIRCLAIAMSLAVTSSPAFSGEGANPAGEAPAGPAVGTPLDTLRTPSRGMLIYIDPQTGALLREPAPGTVPLQLTPAFQDAVSTSHQGLVEVPSPAPGGGVSVNLQGRFQSPLFVTTDANGKVRIQHLDETHESDAKK